MVGRFQRLLVAAVGIAGCSGPLSPEDYYGTWGGEGVRLTLSKAVARFESSCWAGDLQVPFDVEGRELIASGNVNWQGGAGGSETRALILIGRQDDNVLHLTVESSMGLGPYTLRPGQQANIPGCP